MDGVSEDTDWPTLTGVLARPDEFRVFRARKLDREPGFSGVVQAGVRLSAATPKRRNDFLLIIVLVLSSVAVVGVIVFLQNSRASGNGASGESGGGLLASVGPDTNPQDGNQPVARSGQQSRADVSSSGNAESGDPSQATESGEEEGGGPPLSAGEALSEMSLEEKVGQLLFLGMTPEFHRGAATVFRLVAGSDLGDENRPKYNDLRKTIQVLADAIDADGSRNSVNPAGRDVS